MATMSSTLVLSLRDRASRPARGIAAALGAINRNAAIGARAAGTVRNLAVFGAGYLGVKAGLDGVVGSAMAFESAMADLAKKSTLTTTQLGQMEKRITQLSNSMPLAKTEIAGLIAQAAQFGIANDELERFALLGAKSSVAFDMAATETAESLSKLKNAYGLTMEGLSGLADAINFTADSAGTSEQRVIDFLLRTGASAKQYGISAQEMAAFGATLNEIGIESAKAGTGMNAMMAKLAGLTKNKKAKAALDGLAGSGYSARLQKKFFDTPVEAMKEFFNLVKKMPAESRAGLLIDFFGLEYQDDAAAIANNIDRITNRLETLTDTSQYLGSVDKTFKIFADTTEQKLKVLRNNVANIGQAFGAHLLPGITAFSDKVVGALGTMDERVSVIDRLSASINGFISGLGLESKTLGGVLNEGFDLLFGKLEGMQAAGERMGRIFDRAQGWGRVLRGFADDIVWATGKLESFFSLEPGSIGKFIGEMGGYGFTLMAASVGISMAAGAVWNLGRALMFLSGASTALAILKGVAKIGKGLLFGGAAAGGAAVTGGGAAGAAGGGILSKLLKGGGSLFSRGGKFLKWGSKITGWLTILQILNMFRRLRKWRNSPEGAEAKDNFYRALNDNWQQNSTTGMGNTSGPLNILRGAEEKLKGKKDDGPDEVSILGTPRVTVTNPPLAPNVTVSVTVHATTNADPQQIGDQVAAQVGARLREEIAGLQADSEYAVA